MRPIHEAIRESRRDVPTSAASGAGLVALASLLRDEGLLAAEPGPAGATGPLAPRPPHFAPRARACICIYLEGAPSQIDLFDRFAAHCLLARRLVERGVRFVNLYHASWDHHSDLDRELGFNTAMADRPIAALLKDLKRRGLLDTTPVLWVSEFGRTPPGENRPGFPTVNGRDHHPFAFSLWLAGGGIKGGQVIGRTDGLDWNIVEDPVHVHDYHATILHLFGFELKLA